VIPKPIKISAGVVATLAGLAGFAVLANQRNWTPFLAAGQPVTEDQLRATLVSENWTDIQIPRPDAICMQ